MHRNDWFPGFVIGVCAILLQAGYWWHHDRVPGLVASRLSCGDCDTRRGDRLDPMPKL